jgi:hypothetical protein
MFLKKINFVETCRKTMLCDATTSFKMKSRLDICDCIIDDLYEYGVVPPFCMEPYVGIKLRRVNDQKVFTVVNLELFKITEDMLDFNLKDNELVTTFMNVGLKNKLKTNSTSYYDGKSNQNGLGMYLTLDYFKYFARYMSCEEYCVFLISRIFSIDECRDLFEIERFPLKVDFFYFFGVGGESLLKNWFVEEQKKLYNKLVKDPIALIFMDSNRTANRKCIESRLCSYGPQMMGLLNDVSKQDVLVDIELCESCSSSFVPMEYVYTSDLFSVDCHGVEYVAIKYKDTFIVSHEVEESYLKLKAHYSTCCMCIKRETKSFYDEKQDYFVEVEFEDAKEEGPYSVNLQMIDLTESVRIKVEFPKDASELNNDNDYIWPLLNLRQSMNHLFLDYIAKGKSESFMIGNSLAKEYDFFDSRHARIAMTNLFLEHELYISGVWETFFFVMKKLNKDRYEKFLRVFEVGCITKYDFIKEGLRCPKQILNDINNNLFFQKNFRDYVNVILLWVDKGFIKLKFSGKYISIGVDRASFKSWCQEDYMLNDMIGPINQSVLSRTINISGLKLIKCLITGRVVDSYYQYLDFPDMCFDRVFLDGYLNGVAPFYKFNDLITLTRSNLYLPYDRGIDKVVYTCF